MKDAASIDVATKGYIDQQISALKILLRNVGSVFKLKVMIIYDILQK